MTTAISNSHHGREVPDDERRRQIPVKRAFGEYLSDRSDERNSTYSQHLPEWLLQGLANGVADETGETAARISELLWDDLERARREVEA